MALRLTLLAFLSVSLLSACSSFEEEVDVHVEIQGDTFLLNADTGLYTVPFIVQNRGAAVYVPRCNFSVSVAVERRAGNAWVNASHDVCQTVYDMTALRLEPGEEQQSARGVYGEPGLYRLRLAVKRSVDGDFSSVVVSEAFVLE